MCRTILVPLDGSAFSERALPMATALAQAMKAQVILMRAASAAVFPGADPTEAQVQAVQEAKTYLSALATELAEQGLHVECATPYGDAGESILLEISLYDADLVVMCTHGRSGLGRWIYGSVAEQVLARSPAPVLLVRPTGEAAVLWPATPQPSLLVPLDGSAFAESALPHAVALAQAFGGTILLLRTVEPSLLAHHYPLTSLAEEALEQEKQQARSYLESVAERLRNDGIAANTTVLTGWPADIIVYRGAALGPQLIVMATHGHTGVRRLLLGNVALEVVRRSPLPVLLIGPTEMAETDQG